VDFSKDKIRICVAYPLPQTAQRRRVFRDQRAAYCYEKCLVAYSGAGTNLKVGGTDPAPSAIKKFFVPLHFFGSKSIISRFGDGERFRDGQLVSFLCAVLLLSVPPCLAICKSHCLHTIVAKSEKLLGSI